MKYKEGNGDYADDVSGYDSDIDEQLEDNDNDEEPYPRDETEEEE